MSSFNCCFLTHIQVSQETGKVILHSHLFRNFTQSVVIHTVKVFGVVNKAEEDVSLEFLCFLHDPAYVDNLMSGSSSISKPNLHVWKLLVQSSHTAEF